MMVMQVLILILLRLVISRIQKFVKRNVRKIRNANFGPTIMSLPNGDLEEKNVGFKTQMLLKSQLQVTQLPEDLRIVQTMVLRIRIFTVHENLNAIMKGQGN